MKTTGITRRIDELGRIVIPKEIRKNMHLKPGELLEIFLNDSETITLKKHSIISKKEEFITKYINVLASNIKADIYITSLNSVEISNKEEVIGEKISDDLEKALLKASLVNKDKINITKSLSIKEPFSTYFLRPNGDLSGIFIISFKENENKENDELATDNEEIATSEVTVIAQQGAVRVANAAGKKVVVTNILGQTVANTVITSSDATIAAPQGVVVVAVEGEEAVKAIVK